MYPNQIIKLGDRPVFNKERKYCLALNGHLKLYSQNGIRISTEEK